MASKVRVLLLYVRMHTIGHASLHKMTRLRYAQWECRSKSARKVMQGGTGKSPFKKLMVPFLSRFMFDLKKICILNLKNSGPKKNVLCR